MIELVGSVDKVNVVEVCAASVKEEDCYVLTVFLLQSKAHKSGKIRIKLSL